MLKFHPTGIEEGKLPPDRAPLALRARLRPNDPLRDPKPTGFVVKKETPSMVVPVFCEVPAVQEPMEALPSLELPLVAHAPLEMGSVGVNTTVAWALTAAARGTITRAVVRAVFNIRPFALPT